MVFVICIFLIKTQALRMTVFPFALTSSSKLLGIMFVIPSRGQHIGTQCAADFSD